MAEEPSAEGVRERHPMTREERNKEYFFALEKWLEEVHSIAFTCNMFSGFPFGMMMGGPPGAPPMSPPMPFPVPPMMFPPQDFINFNVNNPPIAINVGPMVEYRIPPMWKRLFAECIDFIILIFVKLVVTFIAVDYFNFINLDKYDIEMLQNPEKLDSKLAMEVAAEILVLELIHRLIVCFYESFTLAQNMGDQVGGATPGKSLMGIRVISCRVIIQGNAPNVVRIAPATTLGLGQSICRAVLKNLIMALLFPICLPLFFKKFNRTGYDMMCRCVVVEDLRPRGQ